ncbi:hypothetical protein BaRGS_00024886, partial [Batillaria attramentaria]
MTDVYEFGPDQFLQHVRHKHQTEVYTYGFLPVNTFILLYFDSIHVNNGIVTARQTDTRYVAGA